MTVTTTAPLEFANPDLREIDAVVKTHTRQSPLRAVMLEISAWSIIVGSVPLLGAGLLFLPRGVWVLALILTSSLYLFVITPFAHRLRRLAKRHRIDAHADLRRDARKPVLYLRPFYYDFTSDPERFGETTDEELLTVILQDLGPVVAVGDPKEDEDPDKSLPILGASRIYLKGNDWQVTLEKLMLMSQVVVLHPGTSKGITWELGAAAKHVGPSKLLISFLSWYSLGTSKRIIRYATFKQAAESELYGTLGKDIRFPQAIGNAMFLTFNADWTPKLITVSRWNQRFFQFSFSALLRQIVRPVLKERGMKLSGRPTNWYVLFMMLYGYGFVAPVLVVLLNISGSSAINAIVSAMWIALGGWTDLRPEERAPALAAALLFILPPILSTGFLFLTQLSKGLQERLDRAGR